MSEKYANYIFRDLIVKLPRYIKSDIQIANFKDEATKKASQILETCDHIGATDLILGGWCNGGLEVIRIAQELPAKDIHLLPILLFDTYEPGYYTIMEKVNLFR
jgi:hypothetical protein